METSLVWLVGAGNMAIDYIKVLQALNKEIIVIGRGEENCKHIEATFGINAIPGGITDFLNTNPELPSKVIVAVNMSQLQTTTIALLDYGVKDILVEKPGVANHDELDDLCSLAEQKEANILLAYNRRFYASVIKAMEIIEEDGGLSSFNFEFTEWSHIVKDLKKDPVEHQNWFLGNSTHIVDIAFFIGGKPIQMQAYTAGQNELPWHKASAVFSGAGITEKQALFSYAANWQAPGRWSMEFLTKKHRLIFRPIEKLQIQRIGSVKQEELEGVDYTLDNQFKPGLFLQTKAFLENDFDRFCNLSEQKEMIKEIYLNMSNYI